jgi:hypothetical protein
MGDYRLYCLDGAGRISLAEWLQAKDDEHAVAMAREIRPDALKCEIWQGPRLVARIDGGKAERGKRD